MDLDQFERDGFAIAKSAVSANTLGYVSYELGRESTRSSQVRRGGQRDIVDHLPLLRNISEDLEILKIMSEILGEEAFLVRATLFDNTPEANWKVPWHQDVTIAVKKRIETPGYGPWSVKSGIPHVQPPSHVLERMLTIRLHLDSCPETNGALWVMPGSHHLGRLNQNEVSSHVKEEQAVCCAVNAGDLLVMRPLLLHSSSASLEPAHRRVLHFDFAIADLPNGLKWRMRDYARQSLFHEPVEQ
jgi:ectoine hydroxylase-related dioxygenase (phytanoyl-CoA dioxygenase family)